MFRFSLKWILAAMVYAAIAAAAFSQETWVYADILCAISLLALGYAVMLIIYARGERQAAAAGFAVFMVLLAACLLMAPQSVPSFRILTGMGVGQTQPSMPISAIPPPIMATGQTVTAGQTLGTISSSASGTLSVTAPPRIQTFGTPASSWVAPTPAWSLVAPISSIPDITLKLRAFNAIATMTIGLLGCLLGVLAYRRAAKSVPPLRG